MADLDITGRVVFDASQAEGALDKLGGKADKMASDVSGAAGKAGQAVDKIGEGASGSAEKFTRAEGRIVDSIKRTQTSLELLGKTASQKLEFKINEKGLDPAKFEPALAKLREIEAAQVALGVASVRSGSVAATSLNSMGMSANATAAALRGVPAQFTDIVTSIQGGQAPLTVFLQQGGQLKDMFGGAGNAARALGGYIVGLVNPYTIAAAAIAGLGLAMASVNNKEGELTRLSVRLSATGRGALSATGDIKQMIAELNNVPGVSRSAASAIIDEFSRVQGVGSEIFKGLGASVADFAAATGTDLPTAAKKLASAFADPAKGAKDLESALGTLSAEQLLTIEKMAALGDKTGAQTALLEALQIATKGLASDAMTPLGKATDTLSNSWDGLMKSVSNSDALQAANVTLGSIIKGVAYLIDAAPKFPRISAGLAFGPLGVMAAQIGLGVGDAAKALTPNVGVTGSWAAGPTPASELNNQVKDVLEATGKYKSTGSELERVKALATQAKDALAGLEKQNRGTSVEAQALRDRIGGLNEELTKLGKRGQSGAGSATAGQSEVASIRAKVIETQRYIDAMKSQGLEAAKQTEGEKLAAKYREELTGGLKGAARANKELALAQAEKLDGLQKEQSALEGLLKAQKDFEAAREKEIISRNNEILKIEEKAQALEDEIAAYGMGKAAIEAMTIARLEEEKTILGGFDGSQERIAQIDAEIAARKRYAADSDKLAGLKAGTQAEEVLRNAKEQAKLYEDEYKLTGLTALERAKVVAQRKVELDYAKKLAELDKLPDGPEKESARIKINEAKLIESSAAVNKVIQDDFAKTADQINQSLTDALMRGFESGKGFGQSLRDSLINMFKTLVLRPIISAVMAPVSGVVNGAIGMGLDAVGLGGGGGIGGALGMASNASSLYSMSQGGGMLGAFSGQGMFAGSALTNGIGSLTGSITGLTAANTSLATTIGISTAEAAAGASAAAAAGGTGTLTAGLSTGLAAVPVAGWIALAALAAYSVFAGKQDERFGSQGSYTPGKGTQSNGGPNGALDDFGAVSAGNKATATTIDKILERVGSKDRLSYFAGGFESSKNDKGFSYAGGILSNGKVFGQGTDGMGYMNLRGSMSPEEAQARYANELKQATLEALQSATDIPKAISGKLEGVDIESLAQKDLDALVGVIDKIITEVDLFSAAIDNLPIKNLQDLSFDTTAALIEAAGGLQKLSEGTAFIFQNLYSESERAAVGTAMLSEQFAALGLAVPESDAALRQLIESQDLTTESGRNLAISVGGLAPAFVAAANAARAAAQNMLSAMADYASQGEQKAFAVEQIRQGLADGGLNISADQIGSATRDQAWQLYKDQLAAGNLQQADAIKNQLAAFAKITQPTNAGNMMGGSGSSGGSSVGGSSSALDAWQSATDAIVQTMKDLRQTLIGDGPNAMAQLQAQFAIESAKASAGDLEAYKGLPTLAKALANTGQNYSSSALEQALLTARIIESLGNVVQARTGEKVPGFASGGYHSGGWAVVGENGPELANFSSPARIYTAADTKSLQGGDNAETIAELREQNRLLSELLAAGLRTAGNTGKAAKTLDDAAAGVAPLTTIAA